MKVLVTGVAGFIGMHCAKRLLARGDEVWGIDNFSSHTPVELKKDRLAQLKDLQFEEVDIADQAGMNRVFRVAFDYVLHLAAQAGVRYSIDNPQAFVHSNLVGFASLLECCRRHPPRHLVYASSSSVYGANRKLPWSESDDVGEPLSFYAATKRANELMAHAYHRQHGLAVTGLRYFTVYGPWGRPDMSPMLFARAIMEGKPIRVFNHGDMSRDFTYVDDAVEATLRLLDKPSGYAIYNVGNRSAVPLLDYIAALERALGRKARLDMQPMQPGDVKATCADTRALEKATGFSPTMPLETGLARFAEWFKSYDPRS